MIMVMQSFTKASISVYTEIQAGVFKFLQRSLDGVANSPSVSALHLLSLFYALTETFGTYYSLRVVLKLF